MYNKQQLEDNSIQNHSDASHSTDQINIDLIQTTMPHYDFCSSFQCTLFKTVTNSAFKAGYDTEPDGNKPTTTNLTIAKTERELIKGFSAGASMEGVFYGVDIGAAGKIMQEIKIHANEIVVVCEVTHQSGYERVKVETLALTEEAEETLKKDPATFYKQWGSHFLAREAKGDTFYFILVIESEQTENLEDMQANLNVIFNTVSFESGLSKAISETKKTYNTKVHIEQTGGPVSGIGPDDVDGLLKWINSVWIPAVDANPSTLHSTFEGYWTLGGIGDELRTVVNDDMSRIDSLIDAIEDYDEASEQLGFIVFDHDNSRFPKMPVNYYGTSSKEISTIKTYEKEIVTSRAVVVNELEARLLNHLSFDELCEQSKKIAKRPEAYIQYINGLNLKARYPIVPGEDVHFHTGSKYVGLDSDKTYATTTSSGSADMLRLVHNNRFLLNNNTVYIQSPAAEGIGKGKTLTKHTLHDLRYEKKGAAGKQEWKVTCSKIGSNEFIRPKQDLQVWNTQHEQYMIPWKGYLNTDSPVHTWTVERA